MYVEFLDVFIHCGLNTDQKNGKYQCPFCGKYSFVIYPDAKSYCHNCKFSGNAIRFCSQVKGISYEDAFSELTTAYKDKKIQNKQLSFKESIKQCGEDLYFVSMLRMYFEFYKDNRYNKQYYKEFSGVHPKAFDRVLSGEFEKINPEIRNMVLTFLRSKIDIEKFKKDLLKGTILFNDEAYEFIKDNPSKYLYG